MTDSPCTSGRTPDEIFCPFLYEDKNDERCINCEARLKYAVTENMLPESVLETEEDPVVKVARKMVQPNKEKQKICATPGCDLKVKSRGKCEKHYVAWRRQNTDKVKQYKRGTAEEYTIRIKVHSKDNPERFEIVKKVMEIAQIEMRSFNKQILWFLREGVDRWKGKHGG